MRPDVEVRRENRVEHSGRRCLHRELDGGSPLGRERGEGIQRFWSGDYDDAIHRALMEREKMIQHRPSRDRHKCFWNICAQACAATRRGND